MSMPLASTCVCDFPSCGRAIATMNAARANQVSARKIRPARLALLFPMARNGAVAEKTTAARGPSFPRSHASNGINSNNSNNHGRAKVRVCPASQSRGDKSSSFHELTRFIQQKSAVGGRCFIARELDQVTAIKKIGQQRFSLVAKPAGRANGIQKFD